MSKLDRKEFKEDIEKSDCERKVDEEAQAYAWSPETKAALKKLNGLNRSYWLCDLTAGVIKVSLSIALSIGYYYATKHATINMIQDAYRQGQNTPAVKPRHFCQSDELNRKPN